MQEINLTLSVDETNAALAGLTKLPYEVSASVIDKIRTQATPQVVPPADQGKPVEEQTTQSPELLTE